MFQANIHNGEDMFWKTKKHQNHLLALPMQRNNRETSDGRWGNQSFPEYIVDVTRNSLLSFTSSLTKVSSQAHDYFSQLSAMFAFERMMRTCMGWMMPGFANASPMSAMGMMPMGFGMPQMWGLPNVSGMNVSGMPQFAPQPQQPNALAWFSAAFQAPSKPQPKMDAKPMTSPFAAAAELTAYGALLALPTAFLAMAPSMMQAWNVMG